MFCSHVSSRGDSNSEYMLMSPQQQTPSTSLLKKATPPSSYSNKANMEIPLKSGKRNGGGTNHHRCSTLIRFWKALQI